MAYRAGRVIGNLPDRDARTPSQYYRFWTPMQQTGTGAVADHSGNSNDGTICSGNSAPYSTVSDVTWGTPNVGVSSGGVAYWDKDTVINYSTANGGTFMFHMRFQQDIAPAANSFYVGNLTDLNNHSGFSISTTSTAANIQLRYSDGSSHSHGFGTNLFGTTADTTTYSLSLWMDGTGRKCYGFFNGVSSSGGTWTEAFPASFVECTMDDVDFTIGGGSPSQAAGDALYQDCHCMVFPSLPTNYTELAQTLNSRPFVPLIDSEIDL